MFTTLLTIAAMFAFVLAPVLIPAAVHVVHGIRNWQPRALPTLPVAVPAAA